jgi:hypothetical protein
MNNPATNILSVAPQIIPAMPTDEIKVSSASMTLSTVRPDLGFNGVGRKEVAIATILSLRARHVK